MSVNHLFAFLFSAYITVIESKHHVLHCSTNLFCEKESHGYDGWEASRAAALRLIELQEVLSGADGLSFVHNSSQFFNLIAKQRELCRDDTYTGFLLDDSVRNMTNSCLWTGKEASISCARTPARYKDDTFYYMNRYQWQNKIREFRQRIGCSAEEIDAASQVQELYICNDRCIQGGIGYLPSIIMLLSFSTAFIRSCLP